MNGETSSRSSRRGPYQMVHARISRKTFERFKAYTAATGATDRAVMNAALEQYLDRSSDTELIYRRLDKISRGVRRAHRQTETVAEFLALFVHIWFAHTASVSPEQQKAAKQSADKRYEDMLEYLRKRLTGSKRLLVDLLGGLEGDQPPGVEAGAKGVVNGALSGE